ncbi:MAG: hypothetical protein Q8O25_10110 [Sulfurisoma sp.]|nr:hypothetical protein [Sulfurisoma sp.]
MFSIWKRSASWPMTVSTKRREAIIQFRKPMRRPGHFILTGSRQFGLLSGITQNLAGRVALLNLLPFTAAELRRAGLLPNTPDEAIHKEIYPPIYDRNLDPGTWYANYPSTRYSGRTGMGGVRSW